MEDELGEEVDIEDLREILWVSLGVRLNNSLFSSLWNSMRGSLSGLWVSLRGSLNERNRNGR